MEEGTHHTHWRYGTALFSPKVSLHSPRWALDPRFWNRGSLEITNGQAGHEARASGWIVIVQPVADPTFRPIDAAEMYSF
jgi:hypothetical protein